MHFAGPADEKIIIKSSAGPGILRALYINRLIHSFENGLLLGGNFREIIQFAADIEILSQQTGTSRALSGRFVQQNSGWRDLLRSAGRLPEKLAARVQVGFE